MACFVIPRSRPMAACARYCHVYVSTGCLPVHKMTWSEGMRLADAKQSDHMKAAAHQELRQAHGMMTQEAQLHVPAENRKGAT